jgi:hypothetical protein
MRLLARIIIVTLLGTLFCCTRAQARTGHLSARGLPGLTPTRSDIATLDRRFGRDVLNRSSIRQTVGKPVSVASLVQDGHVPQSQAERDGYVAGYDSEYLSVSPVTRIRAIGGEVLMLTSTQGAHNFLENVVFSSYVRKELKTFKMQSMGTVSGLGADSSWLRFQTSRTRQEDIVTWRHGRFLSRVSAEGPSGRQTYAVVAAEARLVNARVSDVS